MPQVVLQSNHNQHSHLPLRPLIRKEDFLFQWNRTETEAKSGKVKDLYSTLSNNNAAQSTKYLLCFGGSCPSALETKDSRAPHTQKIREGLLLCTIKILWGNHRPETIEKRDSGINGSNSASIQAPIGLLELILTTIGLNSNVSQLMALSCSHSCRRRT